MRRQTMEPPIYPKEVNKGDNKKLNYYIAALKLWTQVLGEDKEPGEYHKVPCMGEISGVC